MKPVRSSSDVRKMIKFFAAVLVISSALGVYSQIAAHDQFPGLSTLRRTFLFDSFLSAIQSGIGISAGIGMFLFKPWGWWLGVSLMVSEVMTSVLFLTSVWGSTTTQQTAESLKTLVYGIGMLAAEVWFMTYLCDEQLMRNLRVSPRSKVAVIGLLLFVVSGSMGLIYALSVAFTSGLLR